MADDNFREIQLSGKQLFFLFMASVVVLVVVFLLGVSVGRGVRTTPGPSETTSAAVVPEPARPADQQPATQLTPADKAYTDRLQGTTPAQPKPAEPVSAPPAQTAKPQTTAPAPPPDAGTAKPAAPPPAETQKPAAPPASTAKPAAQTPPPTKPAGEGWVLQVGAFDSRPNADNLVKQLKGKGYAAFVFSPGRGESLRVRIGPFATRAEADRVAAKYQREEGTRPLVTR